MIAFRKGLGASNYNDQILSALPAYCPSCPSSLVLSLVQAESSGNQFTNSGGLVTSSAGAQGLFQLMPATAAGLNVDATTPAGNIQGGLTLLQQLWNQYGNWTEALEAYNEGSGNLSKQIAAGQTPVSAGYAAGILSAAGISDSTVSDSPDLGITADLSPPVDLSALTDLPAETGLSWPVLAGVAAGLLFLPILFSPRQ